MPRGKIDGMSAIAPITTDFAALGLRTKRAIRRPEQVQQDSGLFDHLVGECEK